MEEKLLLTRHDADDEQHKLQTRSEIIPVRLPIRARLLP